MAARRMGLECTGRSHTKMAGGGTDDQFLVAELARSVLVHETSLPQADHSRIVGRSQGTLLVVAAGSGSLGSGAVASTVAVDAVTGYVLNAMPWFYRLESSGADDLVDTLDDAVARCRTALQAARGDGDAASMTVALTMAYVIGNRAYVVHVGSTSCYLWHPPALRRVTRDRASAPEPADAASEAAARPWRHVVWPAAGRALEDLEPEVVRLELEPGDALLLCTPGLTRSVPDVGLLEELSAPVPLGEGSAICDRLLARAREAGGTDDATVVLARTRPGRERRRTARLSS